MQRPPRPLTAIEWTADLVTSFGDAMMAIGQLDARVSASSVAPAWRLRASWTGYAAALRLQQYEIEEIDVISYFTGVAVPGRQAIATSGDPFANYQPWLCALGKSGERHWREDLPFTFDLPEGWNVAPPLARVLALVDSWSRTDPSSQPWLAAPILLHRMKLIQTPLPCLVTGDVALRTLEGPRKVRLKRLLKSLHLAARTGLNRLDNLEHSHLRFADAIEKAKRPGSLTELARLILSEPVQSPRSLADRLAVTLSGAGKLLARAVNLGLLTETSGRASWKLYMTPEVGIALGTVRTARGRPPSLPRSSPMLDKVLAKFDQEMIEIDSILASSSTRVGD
ncbi:hypothetical protein IM511_12440 [Erythrobacteraceae bacterium E2-1 Yellow Sea]|nr:hypothetical protein [Erythrobacteraceae bacterium E2-1 Yellow Sea]